MTPIYSVVRVRFIYPKYESHSRVIRHILREWLLDIEMSNTSNFLECRQSTRKLTLL